MGYSRIVFHRRDHCCPLTTSKLESVSVVVVADVVSCHPSSTIIHRMGMLLLEAVGMGNDTAKSKWYRIV
jgi:hypothetical protein